MNSYYTRIEARLGEVCTSPDNKFQITNAYYSSKMFSCQLCGHFPCKKAFEVTNLETKEILKVGSECIHQFGFDELQMHILNGLMDRINSAMQTAKRDLFKKLGLEAWEALAHNARPRRPTAAWLVDAGKAVYADWDDDKKSQTVVDTYMLTQAMDLLKDVHKGVILNEEQTDIIINMGMKEEFDKGVIIGRQKKAEKLAYAGATRDLTEEELAFVIENGHEKTYNHYAKNRKFHEARTELRNMLNTGDDDTDKLAALEVILGAQEVAYARTSIEKNKYENIYRRLNKYIEDSQYVGQYADVDNAKIEEFKAEFASLPNAATHLATVDHTVSHYRAAVENHKKLDSIRNYTGNNSIMADFKRKLANFGDLSESQFHLAQQIISAENAGPDAEFEKKIIKLLDDANFSTHKSFSFIQSIFSHYKSKGTISVKQRFWVNKIFSEFFNS